ncbi:MAG TPA: galactose-1-phosphate uridylyltransferase [Pyrinomonadaceae bacterium]|nr:galactose-1-phosphate uridylyltransferase [Pyrinomonadaceae bacterium]
MSELRYNPLLGEWLATATHRQDRTFLPPADFCPLCPTKPGAFPTEVPEQDYDIVAFENRFPSLKRYPDPPAVEPDGVYAVEPGIGVCEVILYSPDHQTSLAAEPVEKIHKLVRVWRHRFEELEKQSFVKYVFIFENKGEAVGVTLHHPHGQIYAYPFVPPVVAKELAQTELYLAKSSHCLLCDIIDKETLAGIRMVAENDSFAAYIPFFARYPFEVHIASKKHLQALTDMTAAEMRDLAAILKQVLSAYDKLFSRSFPYIMAIHQRPSDGGTYEHYHFHIEFYPPMRTAVKLKYLAGSEAGAGMFINDTLPETKAAELRALVEPVEWK